MTSVDLLWLLLLFSVILFVMLNLIFIVVGKALQKNDDFKLVGESLSTSGKKILTITMLVIIAIIIFVFVWALIPV